MKKVVLFFILFLYVFLTGCEELVNLPVQEECPGKTNLSEALETLNNASSNIQPFIAYGKGRVKFYDEEKKKDEDEPISAVKIWFDPPDKFRFWGDVVFNNRGLDVGSNETEFWFTAMPKELGNMYIWGLWSQQKDSDDLLLSPRIMRQAFGYIDLEKDKVYSLVPGKYQDILVQRDMQGFVTKKVYIDNCDYNVLKVEYYGIDQEIFAVLELYEHHNIDDKMILPMKLKIIKPDSNGNSDTISITLKSIKPQDKIKDAIFKRPQIKRFKNIYKLENGKAIDQSK